MTNAIVATATPMALIALMILMACVLFLAKIYLLAMKKGKFIDSALLVWPKSLQGVKYASLDSLILTSYFFNNSSMRSR